MEFLWAHLPIDLFLSQYGCAAVFVVIGLESAGMPLPGEITLVAAALLAGSTHHLNITNVLSAAVAGAVLGDNVGYWLGREFGFRLLLRYGPRVGIQERQLKLGQYMFLRHGGKVVFFGRMVAVLRVLAAVLAGVNRMPWGHFLVCNIGGALFWAGLYGGGAYMLGQQIKLLTGPLGLVGLALGVIVTILLIRYVRHHQWVLEEAAELACPGPIERPQHHLPDFRSP